MESDYNTKPIKIDFPKSMKVHSPELKAVEASTRTIANILTHNLIKIAEGIQAIQELPELFKQLKKLVADQFANLFTTQVEADIMNRQANVKVLAKKIGFVEKHVSKKEEQLEKTNNQIASRFKGISGEMTKEHELFLQKLDSHVYSITEQIYPRQVQERFSYDIQPNIDYLQGHAIESAYVRTKCLSDAFLDAKRKVDNFLIERNIFYEEFTNHEIETDLETGDYYFPVWFAEVLDNETGEIETKIVYPWENNEEINSDALSIIEQMVEESLEIAKNKFNNNQELNDELHSWMTENKIPEKEIIRFNSDCETIIMEE